MARLVYAAGDPDLAERVSLVGDPIPAAIEALAGGANLVVDVGMVAAGLSPTLLSRLGIEVHVAIRADGVAALAEQHGITRSAAGILALADRLDGAVVAIGNAPTALLALLDLCAAGKDSPGRRRRDAGRVRRRRGVEGAAAGGRPPAHRRARHARRVAAGRRDRQLPAAGSAAQASV